MSDERIDDTILDEDLVEFSHSARPVQANGVPGRPITVEPGNDGSPVKPQPGLSPQGIDEKHPAEESR